MLARRAHGCALVLAFAIGRLCSSSNSEINGGIKNRLTGAAALHEHTDVDWTSVLGFGVGKNGDAELFRNFLHANDSTIHVDLIRS
jgi:hypothetical protein